MSATSVTLRGRAKALELMQDACTVQHLTGSSADQEVGTIVPTWSTVYSGVCKVQQAAPASAPTTIGEAEIFVGQLTLHLPVNTASAAVTPDDLVTITACALDASLVGKTFRLRGPAHKSYATARRFPLIEAAG